MNSLSTVVGKPLGELKRRIPGVHFLNKNLLVHEPLRKLR
jgi:hypothetical protein